ncbi:MAG: hypothetical protein MUP30_06555 [Deltaproteobacteria bacterium]|nr:hypothetical protein [Deltaproteobacteria bacterium]
MWIFLMMGCRRAAADPRIPKVKGKSRQDHPEVALTPEVALWPKGSLAKGPPSASV